MELLPIGCIIEINSVKMIILGTEFIDEKQKFVFNYLVSLYPIGITNENSIFSISVENDFDLIYKGYEDNDGRNFIKEHKELYSDMRKISPSELADFFDSFSKALMSEKEN